MLELLIILPNLTAQLMCSLNKAFYSNLIYSFGYLLFIYHNLKIGDPTQLKYFVILEAMAVGGVIIHLIKIRSSKDAARH